MKENLLLFIWENKETKGFIVALAENIYEARKIALFKQEITFQITCGFLKSLMSDPLVITNQAGAIHICEDSEGNLSIL